MKIIVVGAGIVGASVAYRLSQAGAEVVVFDRYRIGGGTSSVTYAWVNACEKLSSRDYYVLNMAGRTAHQRIAEELGGADWYPRPGIIQWQDAQAEAGNIVDSTPADDKYKLLKEWGYPAEIMSGDDVAKLAPDLAAGACEGRSVIHYPEDGWCYATQYAGRVAGAAVSRYGAVFQTAMVRELLIKNGRCGGVILTDGRVVEADAVVDCAGRWSMDIIANPDFHIPLHPTAGLVAITAPAGIQLMQGLRTPKVNLRPDGGGRFFLRAGDIDGNIDLTRPASDYTVEAAELMLRARELLPALENVPMEAVRVAIRPEPADGYSAIGQIPDIDGLHVAVTHSGVTLAPFIAEGLTQEILEQKPVKEFSSFRPARFFKGAE